MTMKHGLLPEDRSQDHGAVHKASTVASLLDVLGDASHGRANVSRIEHPEDIEKVLAAAESLAAIISAAPSGQDQEPL